MEQNKPTFLPNASPVTGPKPTEEHILVNHPQQAGHFPHVGEIPEGGKDLLPVAAPLVPVPLPYKNLK